MSFKDALSVSAEASRKTAYQYSRGGRGCTTHCSTSMEHLTAALQVSIWRADPFCKQGLHCVRLKGTNLATRRSSIRFPRFLLMGTCRRLQWHHYVTGDVSWKKVAAPTATYPTLFRKRKSWFEIAVSTFVTGISSFFSFRWSCLLLCCLKIILCICLSYKKEVFRQRKGNMSIWDNKD